MSFLTTPLYRFSRYLDAKPDRSLESIFFVSLPKSGTVYYDELKRNPKSYIERILTFHGYEGGDLSEAEPPEPGQMHFRKGQHGQWREDFAFADVM